MLSALRNTINTPVRNVLRLFQTSAPQSIEDKKWNYKKIPKDDDGVAGEKIVDLDSMIKQKQNLFPTLESDDMLFDGTPYKQLAVANVRVTHNNTIVSITDSAGVIKMIRSCGMDGFKNTKKGTNIAAQTTAFTLATKAIDKGFRTVRVKVRGLGPGRLAAIKGLQMGGLDIVSITDTTRVSWNPPRPRKAKRL
ncbi:hypothetical protein JYU34_003881 [Plutella xylostella]|uniref:Uncharacterized protein n=2 Tax=Plutella xylostella TaxID=51655 RepID=A0ABQ7R198_PLUXY|nr:30S ribosomal protein S11 [Plutella xylostella]KAG7311024.1 hypothetical protein JYU34_003881 [Plutella xylostella]CAG9132431.1 unnamed protein product [Plutella xylostella]